MTDLILQTVDIDVIPQVTTVDVIPASVLTLTGGFPKQYALPFQWNNVSTQTIWTGTGRIVKVEIGIDTPFDVPSLLTVGDNIVSDRLMTAAQNDPTIAGVWQSAPFWKYTSSTSVILTIAAGLGCSQGSGSAIIYFE